MSGISNNPNVNFNIQNFGNTALGGFVPTQLPADVAGPNSVMGKFLEGFESGFANGLLEGFKDGLSGALTSPSTPCSPPSQSDSSHSGLKTDPDGTVTTPGGYKIQSTNQYEWTITAPDGKKDRIWGDPHMDIGNDGKSEWDFKKPTTFVLGDGTRINVGVQPYNNMTVTNHLQILSGNDRVEISDIEKGKGKASEVTHDGFAHTNDFGGKDVIVQGKDISQWSFQGKEILGSENGGDSFKLGNELKPIVDVPKQNGGVEQWAGKLMEDLGQLLKDLMPPTRQTPPFPGQNPYSHNPAGGYNRDNHLQGLGNAFKAMGDMLKVMGDLLSMTQQLNRHSTLTTL